MWLDAILAYLHFLSIFILFATLVGEMLLLRTDLDAATVRLLGRVDIAYFAAAIAVLATGALRLFLGAKGSAFYLSSWPIYVKLALFAIVGIVSIKPTLRFIAWRKARERDAAWTVPEAERTSARRALMIEIHVAALIPLAAVIMSRGLVR